MIWIPDGLKMTGAATRAVTTNGAEKNRTKLSTAGCFHL